MSNPGYYLSSSASKSSRDRMKFTDNWGEGEVFDWYRSLPKASVTVSRLQIRIEGSKPPHRFILVFMRDGSICRFDRRPDNGKPGPLILETLFSQSTRRAADERVAVTSSSLEQLEATTFCEVDLVMPFGIDLLLIISACFAIAKDGDAQNYNLLTYNCYFFSWTVVMVVIRHALPLVAPSSEGVALRLAPEIKALSSSLSDSIVATLVGMVLDMVVAFRVQTGRSLNKGLGKRELLFWALPAGVVRLCLRICFSIRLQLRLEEELSKRIYERLTLKMKDLLDEVLHSEGAVEEKLQMEQHLWINELTDAVRPLVEEGLSNIIWDATLDAIGAGYGDLSHTEFLDSLRRSPSLLWRIKFFFMGNNMIQFTRLWNEALHAALPAIRAAGYGKTRLAHFSAKNEIHSHIFDTAFKAGSVAALQAAQRVVDETGPALNNPKRDEMWKKVWSVWDQAWDSSKEKAQTSMVQLIERATEQIVALVAKSVADAIGDNQDQQLQAVINRQSQKSSAHPDPLLSLSQFQIGIVRSVQSAYPSTNKEYIKEIQDAMTRIWHESRTSYRPLNEQSRAI